MNPYTTLGIPTDATDTDIKKAYHNKAKEHHPDVGGDEETFAQINNAHELLSDPDRRAHYDRFGEDTVKGDPIENKAIEVFSSMVNDTIKRYGHAIINNDFLGDMTGAVNKNLEGLDEMRQGIVSNITEFEITQKLFNENMKYKQDKSKVNMFKVVIEANISQLKDKIENLNMQEKVLNRVLEMLSDFDFEVVKKEEPPMTATEASLHKMRLRQELIDAFNHLDNRHRNTTTGASNS